MKWESTISYSVFFVATKAMGIGTQEIYRNRTALNWFSLHRNGRNAVEWLFKGICQWLFRFIGCVQTTRTKLQGTNNNDNTRWLANTTIYELKRLFLYWFWFVRVLTLAGSTVERISNKLLEFTFEKLLSYQLHTQRILVCPLHLIVGQFLLTLFALDVIYINFFYSFRWSMSVSVLGATFGQRSRTAYFL